MSNLDFDSLLDRVLSWWPEELSGIEDDFTDPIQSSSIAILYEEEIEPFSLECGNKLLMQLDWIFFSIVEEISRRTLTTIRPAEIRRSFVKTRFHKLLREVAIPQLQGEMEWDGSFDRKEITTYMSHESLF